VNADLGLRRQCDWVAKGGVALVSSKDSSGRLGLMSIQKSLELLTSEQVSTLTGLSLDTLAQWRSQKRGIPYLKIGRSVRYDLDDVHSYLAGCRVSVSDPNERRQSR
jgi:excisionase family DNA binding protein